MNTETKQNRREQSHQRILDAAARAVRRQGYAGVGVAEVMKEAGLTHGGFYAHFKSRDALLAAAIEHAAKDSVRILSRRIKALQDAGASPVRALVEGYLADEHVDACERGCPVAALGSEMPRQSDELLEVSRKRVRGLVEKIRQALPPTAPAESAFGLAASLVGALQLARALGEEGRALLPATRAALIAQYDDKT
jgi:TetR/AcrR family transcriptional repressor of nem operon